MQGCQIGETFFTKISEAIYETISSIKNVDKDEGTLIDISTDEKSKVEVQIEKVIKVQDFEIQLLHLLLSSPER